MTFVDPVDRSILTETPAGLVSPSGRTYPPRAGGWDLRPPDQHPDIDQGAIYDGMAGEFSDFDFPHNLTLLHERELLEALPLEWGDPVLEIGGHRSGVLSWLEAHRGVKGAGVDVSAEWVAAQNRQAELRAQGTRWVLADAEALPFPDRAFKAVVAFDVLEHVGNLERALREVLRVLDEGGTLVAHLPVADIGGSFDGWQRWRDAADYAARQASVGHFHERLPTRQQMRTRLESVGFHVESVRSFNVWIQPLHDHRVLPALAKVRRAVPRPKSKATREEAASPARASAWQRFYSRSVVPLANALAWPDRLVGALGVGGSASFVARKGERARGVTAIG